EEVSSVKVGIPREVKDHEYRVAITPAGTHELVRAGHEVLIETGAGAGSSIPDEEYAAAGARILPAAADVWEAAELVLKVKEPVPEEYHLLRPDLVLFAFLHLAASECTDALLERGVTAVAYETVTSPDGRLPLLAPMSEVAGRLAPQIGAYHLMSSAGGRGALIGGAPRVGGGGGRAARRGPPGVRGGGGGARRRGEGPERRGGGAGHARRGAAAGQRHRQAAPG